VGKERGAGTKEDIEVPPETLAGCAKQLTLHIGVGPGVRGRDDTTKDEKGGSETGRIGKLLHTPSSYRRGSRKRNYDETDKIKSKGRSFS